MHRISLTAAARRRLSWIFFVVAGLSVVASRGAYAADPKIEKRGSGPREEGHRRGQPQRQLRRGGQEAPDRHYEVRRRQVQFRAEGLAAPRPRRDAGPQRERLRGQGQLRSSHRDGRLDRARPGVQEPAARRHLGRGEEEGRRRRGAGQGGPAAHRRLHAYACDGGPRSHAAPRLRRVQRHRRARARHREVQGASG